MTILQERPTLCRAIASSDFKSTRAIARLQGVAHGGAT